ncbi:hypothetical protein HKX48_007527 [Thoreauomyces humboldtii]|nr:hypothetical protein HKX48_007527 [Thoreauomyces humboldtii]
MALATSFVLALASLAVASPTPQLIGYWGRNLAVNLGQDTTQWEPTLGTICSTTSYTHIYLSSIKLHSDIFGNPALDLDFHCQWPTNKFAGYPTNPAGFNVLSCPIVATDIVYCQSMGIKIIISLSPMDNLKSAAAAQTSATNIYNTFFGGTTAYRPFGAAILDGIDIHAWNNDPNPIYYISFIQQMRALMDADSTHSYTITGSMECPYPDYLLGPRSLNNSYTVIPQLFDTIIPFFTSSPAMCGWGGNNPGFWNIFNTWHSFLLANGKSGATLVAGLPAYYIPEWANAAAGDYIPPLDLYDTQNVTVFRNSSLFAGFALIDVSLDVLDGPCPQNTSVYYSDVLWTQLTLPLTQSGNSTPAASRCSHAARRTGGDKSYVFNGLINGAVTGSTSSVPVSSKTQGAHPTQTISMDDTTSPAGRSKSVTVLSVVLPVMIIAVVALLV